MKLLLINPSRYLDNGKLYKTRYRWLLGITLPYLAALTPPNIEVRIIDETLEDVDYDEDCDLVGITFMSNNAFRAYEIADEFRRRGKKVVMGGFHASFLPQEALQHSDAVVIGEAESVWRKVIQDARNGSLAGIYRAEKLHDLKGLPPPRFDLLDLKRYKMPALPIYFPVQTTRGCPYRCAFCEVSALYGGSYRFRPIEDVLRDIEATGSRHIYFVDDNIAAHKARTKKLCQALKPLNINWAGLCNIWVGRDEELLDAMLESGCVHLNIGIESINQESLKEVDKKANVVDEYHRCLETFRRKGVFFSVNIVFGMDHDDVDVFEKTVRFLIEEKVPMSFMFILTPRVGTRTREQLLSQNRILHDDWSKYAGWNCVFIPAKMSPQELEEGFWRAYRKFYSLRSIIRRHFPIYLNRVSLLSSLASNLYFWWGLKRGKAPTEYY